MILLFDEENGSTTSFQSEFLYLYCFEIAGNMAVRKLKIKNNYCQLNNFVDIGYWVERFAKSRRGKWKMPQKMRSEIGMIKISFDYQRFIRELGSYDSRVCMELQ